MKKRTLPKLKCFHIISVEGVNPNCGTEYISGTVKKRNPWENYYIVGGVFSIYNLRALPSQYSSWEIILRGSGDSIIAGWTVNPSSTRTTAQGSLFMQFFVIVRSDIPMDFALHQISKNGEHVFINQFFVYQEKTSGDWWLEVRYSHPITIGFWPEDLSRSEKVSDLGSMWRRNKLNSNYATLNGSWFLS